MRGTHHARKWLKANKSVQKSHATNIHTYVHCAQSTVRRVHCVQSNERVTALPGSPCTCSAGLCAVSPPHWVGHQECGTVGILGPLPSTPTTLAQICRSCPECPQQLASQCAQGSCIGGTRKCTCKAQCHIRRQCHIVVTVLWSINTHRHTHRHAHMQQRMWYIFPWLPWQWGK